MRRIMLLLMLPVLITPVLRVAAEPQSAQQSLAEAAAVMANEAPRAEELSRLSASLTPALSDSSSRPWALLLKAEALLAATKPGAKDSLAAKALLEQIPANSAASLDARLKLLELSLAVAKPGSKEAKAKLEKLETDLQQAMRSDLLAQLEILKAKDAESSGEILTALGLLRNVRANNLHTPLGKKAAALSDSIIASVKTAELPTSTVLQEAGLLFKELKPEPALRLTESALRSSPRESSSYFEALLLKEQCLRTLAKAPEADAILKDLSANAAGEAKLSAYSRLIRREWNKNEANSTLELISKLSSSMPAASIPPEIHLIKAQAEESLKKDGFRDSLSRLISGDNLSFKAKALRQLAWSYKKTNAEGEAIRAFENAVAVLSAELETLRRNISHKQPSPGENKKNLRLGRELQDDLNHHRYWLLSAYAKSGQKELAEKLKRQLITDSPYSYYGLLAAGPDLNLKQSSRQAGESRCEIRPKSELLNKLSFFKDPELRQFATAEIFWFFSQTLAPEQLSKLQLAKDWGLLTEHYSLEQLLTLTQLLVQYAQTEKGLALADSLLKRPVSFFPKEVQFESCLPALLNIAYPRPFTELYQREAQAWNVPFALTLAISRTESYFNPKARSSSDARGLMQLILSTAQLEGLKADESLYVPSVNIRLGTKHLGSLLQRFNNKLPYVAAAYNAGPSATSRWINAQAETSEEEWVELISYPETRDYAKKVKASFLLYQALYKAEQRP